MRDKNVLGYAWIKKLGANVKDLWRVNCHIYRICLYTYDNEDIFGRIVAKSYLIACQVPINLYSVYFGWLALKPDNVTIGLQK